MKIFNSFKKTSKSKMDTKIQKLEKTQLEKVIGGTDDTKQKGGHPIHGLDQPTVV